jgi:DNA-binding NtrC family response regulator
MRLDRVATLRRMSDSKSPTASGPLEPVLIVDDDKPLLEMWKAALETEFAVTTATSAKDAEFLMRKNTYKVVVSDHLMPGGNGLSFLVRMREEHPRTQRVLVTGYMKPEMLLRSVNEAGLLRYYLKPVTISDLVKTIREGIRAFDEFK